MNSIVVLAGIVITLATGIPVLIQLLRDHPRGLFILFFSSGAGGGQGAGYLVIAGMLACEVACALLAPFIVDKLSRLAWRAPLASRLALRDLARYRSRSLSKATAVMTCRRCGEPSDQRPD